MNPARFLLTALVSLGCSGAAFGWGYPGHETVGALADRLLANDPAAANARAHIAQLLGPGAKLQKAATWADDVKYHFNANDPEMVAFQNANPHHDQYHYTDIPIQETHYRAGSVGASTTDVVHMIRICIAVLEGHPQPGIPPKTALKLLAHYVGDIHQPLHVGAAYFGPGATLVNPNTTQGAEADTGGNHISFHSTNLHSYWDGQTVSRAMANAGVSNPGQFAQWYVTHPPTGTQASGNLSGLGVIWANEQMPIAAAAHNRLTFTTAAAHHWTARAASPQAQAAYDQWAAQQVTIDLGRAGYRLAAVLKRIWP
ncbi:MAG TPA: S1/P1 nuclease [Chthoniobacteraceae bacterium]|jgi:hypothetical protein|nr:S1/P1 nuclease [Chthoniobacteraceae bacterium]